MHRPSVVIWMLASLSLAAQEPSLDKEVALGRVMAADFRKHATLLDNPAVQTYVDRLGQKLAAQMPDARFPFTFAAITGDYCSEMGGPPGMPTAFPGGYLFVPAALFITARDEAEVAGILAHSMEHKVQIVSGASIPLIFIGDSNCLPISHKFRTLQPGYESEADSLALPAMAGAGFDPAALVRYIQRSSFPGRDQRVAQMRAVIEHLPPSNYSESSTEFANIQSEVRRLTTRPASADGPPTLKRSDPR
jgi:predicted Zn-dependent protease